MAIITLSRGTFAGGEQLARLLGEQLGYRTVSREQLHARALEAFGYGEEDLPRLMSRAPTRLDLAARRRRQMFVAIQATLCQLLTPDRVVYHGQAGHLFLPGIEHVLRVRLIAPHGQRVKIAARRLGVPANEASHHVDSIDEERTRWTQFVFGANWSDPQLYDLVLNLERMPLEDAAAVVVCAAQRPALGATPERLAAMENLTLGSQVLARLMNDPSTETLELRVEADGGQVTVRGPLEGAQGERIAALAQQVPGVEGVTLNDSRSES